MALNLHQCVLVAIFAAQAECEMKLVFTGTPILQSAPSVNLSMSSLNTHDDVLGVITMRIIMFKLLCTKRGTL